LVAQNLEHGQRLRTLLRGKEPNIFVRDSELRGAA
jgi:hypothetical protein